MADEKCPACGEVHDASPFDPLGVRLQLQGNQFVLEIDHRDGTKERFELPPGMGQAMVPIIANMYKTLRMLPPGLLETMPPEIARMALTAAFIAPISKADLDQAEEEAAQQRMRDNPGSVN